MSGVFTIYDERIPLIASQMTGLSTLLVGRVFHVETLTFVKVIAVFLSFAGVVLVSLSDSSSTLESKPTNLLWGDFLALVSAIVYGLYVTLLKMFITLSSDYLYVIAMLKTTPLVVTIGLSLTIPLAVIGDLLFGKTVHFLVLIGALIVVFSFIMVGLDDARIRSGSEILQSLSHPEVYPALKKKEKMQAKHDAFMQRLEISSSPYSKSHARRLKRKAKEQIANGLSDMQSAIAALDQDISTLVEQPEIKKTSYTELQTKHYLKPGMIGEGKKAPLSNAQRKCALYVKRDLSLKRIF
ncbi:hypothetical protein C0989_007515 [Termitomyces sp. Mn162]|nr:hypothetical protein C0989_007515 [Termitomyces sp. Mn162]